MKTRVISGIILAVITIPLCLLGGIYFKIFCSVLSILCLKEIINLKGHHPVVPKTMKLVCYFDLIFVLFSRILGISYLNSLEIVFITLFIPSIIYKKEYNSFETFYFFSFIFLFERVFNNLIMFRNINLWYLIYIGSIPIITDIFAMLVGFYIGKHKLIPSISPKKTIEGSIAGSVIGTIISSSIYILTINNLSLIKVIFISGLLTIAAQVSDLLFSKIKRENKIKDFSELIPGHGGILDRLDSLMLVIIIYGIIFLYI